MNQQSEQEPEGYALRSLPWKKIFLGAASFLGALLLAFLLYIWYLLATAPDMDAVSVQPSASATYICDQEGNYLRRLSLASSNRDLVSLSEIPAPLQQAVIAIEDARFYEHHGIDLRGIARAFLTGITHGSFSEGASTITQQLIKNNVFTEWTQENSFWDRFSRKVQEQYLAVRLEKQMGKEEILENYLNTINLGAGCYGVQSAARRYFGKNVSELSLSESAVLAAIPQNPSGYNPISSPEANQRRQATVLQYMADQGYITQDERQEAAGDNVYERILAYNEDYEEETAYSYYEDALIDQVLAVLEEDLGYSSEQAYRAVYSGGLRIYSAQDASLQQICDEEMSNPDNFPARTEFGIDYALSVADQYGAVTHYGSESLRGFVRTHYDRSFDLLCASAETARMYADAFRKSILGEGSSADGTPEDESEPSSEAAEGSGDSSVSLLGERLTLSPQPQASLVLLDQRTGFVRALVGGRGEKQASLTLNRATDTLRQPGSTFKILTAYAPALDNSGQTLATLYDNEPYRYEDGTPVSNWDITDYSGPTTIREAITRSINVVAVKCITEITPRLGFDYAERFGITTLHEIYESGGSVSSDLIQPLALGGITQGVSNLELCAAYGTIANGGTYRTPKFFTKILDRHGEVLIDYTKDTDHGANPGNDGTATSRDDNSGNTGQAADNTRVIQDSTAYLLTSAMEDVVADPAGTAYGTIQAAGQPTAGKTGTTSNYKDIWFAGYTPWYTLSVWGGYDNNKSLPEGSHTYQKTLWSAVMNRVHESLPAADFEQPESVVSVELCRESHLLAVEDGCPDTYTEYFAAGTEPARECALHEPAPETEPIQIYTDILELMTEPDLPGETELPTEEESDTEGQTSPGTETLPPGENEMPPDTPGQDNADMGPEEENTGEADGTGSNSGSEMDSDSSGTSETGYGSESGADTSGSSEYGGADGLWQPDTNSLEDLIDRLAHSGYF